MILALLPLTNKLPDLARFQRAKDAVRIIPLCDLLIPKCFLLDIVKCRLLRVPKLFVGFDPPKEGSQLVRV